MAGDRPRSTDQPKPPPPPVDVRPPISQGEWRERSKAEAKPLPAGPGPAPAKTPDGPPKPSLAESAEKTKAGGPADHRPQPPTADRSRLSTDFREWPKPGPPIDSAKPPAWRGGPVDVTRVTREIKVDVNRYRPQGGGPADLTKLKSDVGKHIKELSELRSKDGGGAFLKVELRNVRSGQGSEAQAIRKSLVEAGAKPGVIVNVRVQDGNKIRAVDGTILGAVSQPGKPGPPEGTPGGPNPVGKPGDGRRGPAHDARPGPPSPGHRTEVPPPRNIPMPPHIPGHGH
jgi:hypothetical protein